MAAVADMARDSRRGTHSCLQPMALVGRTDAWACDARSATIAAQARRMQLTTLGGCVSRRRLPELKLPNGLGRYEVVVRGEDGMESGIW